MQILILIVAMVIVGLIMGWIGGLIWKDNRPYGVRNDYLVAVIVAVVVGLMDWYVIPAMGFSTFMRNLGVAMEPAIGALAALWIMRLVKR